MKLCHISALSLLVLVLGQGCCPPQQLKVGETYNVAKAADSMLEELNYWVCREADALPKALSIPAEAGYSHRLAEARMLGCVPISGEVPGLYRVVVLEQVENLVRVRIITRSDVANNFVGWTDVDNLESSPDPRNGVAQGGG
jgi:hypothetical protein